MRKQANPNDEYREKPVKTIELSEKHLKLRIVIFIIAAAAAMFFIIFGIVQCSNVDSGFAQISSNFSLYDRDFTLMYNLGTKNKPNDLLVCSFFISMYKSYNFNFCLNNLFSLISRNIFIFLIYLLVRK